MPRCRAATVCAVAIAALMPATAFAQVAQFAFTTAPQSIPPDTVSGTITLQAQDSGGASALIPQTACLRFDSASAQGQFSSSATNWNPISVLTMNKGTANKNFYYKDSAEGTHALSVRVASKPESESRSCANWPIEEWSIQWTVAQDMTIGSAQSSSGASSSATTSDPATQTGTASAASGASGPVSSASGIPIEPQIFAYAGKDREVVAGADSVFEARAVNKGGEPIKPGRFLWTFGDGASAEGQTVMHHFAQPGRYAVVLDIAEGLFVASHQVIVTALPVPITLSVKGGNIMLTNTSGKNLDISYWSLRSGGRFFAFPKNTVLLARASVPFTSEVTHLSAAADAALLYPNGVVAAAAGQPAPAASPAPNSRTTVPAAALPAPESAVAFPDPTDTDPVATSGEVAAAANAAVPASYLWWLGAFALALAGGGAMVAARSAGKREWDIIEEKPEEG